MNILINLSNVKGGGGQNVALNFLNDLFQNNYMKHKYFFLVVLNSEIHEFLLKKSETNILTTSSLPTKRIYYELIKFPAIFKKLKINIIYTYFGFGMFACKIPQVCGVAVSNIFFPEIKFWEGNLFKVFIRKTIDRYRIYGIKRANALIFENKMMEERSHSLFNIHPTHTFYNPPSFNPEFEQENLNIQGLTNETVKILLLCGWQRNKNIMKVPEIAYHLKKAGKHFKFIITAPANKSKEHKEFLFRVKNFIVEDMIYIIGPVKKQQLRSLYSQIDFVLLMSKLESFSNNIIESWFFQRPLIISDEFWAREICKNAAYYVNRDNAIDICNAIIKISESKKIKDTLKIRGLEEIRNYPSIKEKTIKEINFIEKVWRQNKKID